MEVSSARSAPVQSTQQPTASQKARQASEATQRQPAEAMPVKAEPPKPVINTQGQATGRLLNVIA
ncbi:hypothetical protein LHU53_06800 [Rhodoferax sp. U2-2l]|uniref:hypothetical protein n=1 Tax=Rhodoferax sp. U2-2l TaxID=2884000 RepID=UPI001D0AF540|nr:hypothetical protein [Rhodoferax sp. U2-2l]MCB8746614.1 hypothetical protein [Rhodoferax sp. U2-2l]